MTTTPGRRLAPEVAAARAAGGIGEVSDVAIGAVTQTELTGVPIVDLVERMHSAARVDIVGVLPRAVGQALMTAEPGETSGTEPSGAGRPTGPPRPTSERFYLTPSRERVAAYRHVHVMGRVVQRWWSGMSCFRNWTTRHMNEADTAEIRLVDDLFLDCVVVCRWPDRDPEVWVLTLLPQSSRPQPREAALTEELVITQVQAASVRSVLHRIDDLYTTGQRVVDSGLICATSNPDPTPTMRADDLPNEFVPVISDFRPVWRAPRQPGTIQPVCVVALTATTSRGPGLLLLHRNVFNARNDFDTLSLLSKRVAEEDFARAVSGTLPEAVPGSDRMEAWWLVLGKPQRMDVPREAFLGAGQREVFMSCGLDLEADRFTYCGTHLLEHDDAIDRLGFVGFRVELRRDDTVDELARAQRWNPDLVFVRAEDLYRARSTDPAQPLEQRPLNRLLTKRSEWVMSTLVGTAGAGAGPDA